jgi:FixJ family two-component response regulator
MNVHAKAVIAIVDDDRVVLESLEDLLESAGYQPLLFGSGDAFLTSGALHSVSCLITDVSMPGMNGLALERHVRRDRPALPVILITGHDAAWRQAQSFAPARDADLLFRKPLDGEALLAAVATRMTLSPPASQ